MAKKTTSRVKWQNYRGGTLPRRHVSRAATDGGGMCCDGICQQLGTENGKLRALPPLPVAARWRGTCRLGGWRHADVAAPCRIPAVLSWLQTNGAEFRARWLRADFHAPKASNNFSDAALSLFIWHADAALCCSAHSSAAAQLSSLLCRCSAHSSSVAALSSLNLEQPKNSIALQSIATLSKYWEQLEWDFWCEVN